MITNTENRKILLSFIVPVYKVEEYLDRCISSILNQTYMYFELILVDDGSPDSCGIICEQWKKKDARIRVFHQENGGLSKARNKGIQVAKGEYLLFVDSDDYIKSDYAERMLEKIVEEDAEIACCNFVYEFMDGTEKTYKGTSKAGLLSPRITVSGREFIQLWTNLGYTDLVIMWNKIYHRSCFDSYRLPSKKLHEDEFSMHHLLYERNRIAWVPYAGYHYTIRSNSITGKGQNYPDYMDALIDRTLFYIEKDDKPLCLQMQGRFLLSVKEAGKKINDKEKRIRKKTLGTIFFKMLLKKWISFPVFAQRMMKYTFLIR